MRILAGLVAVCGLVVGGFWWWITRRPVDHRESISQRWRDEHSRERRD